MGHGFLRLRRWDFLEHGLDGLDTDFYAFGDGDFRNKDWTDGTRIFTPSAMGIFGNTDWMDRTRINKTEFL